MDQSNPHLWWRLRANKRTRLCRASTNIGCIVSNSVFTKLGIHNPAGGTNDTSGTDKWRICSNFTSILIRFSGGDSLQLNGEKFHLSKMN